MTSTNQLLWQEIPYKTGSAISLPTTPIDWTMGAITFIGDLVVVGELADPSWLVRAGLSTYWNASIVLSEAAGGQPITEYSTATRTLLGLRVFEAGANLCAVFGANPDAALTGLTLTGDPGATLTRQQDVSALTNSGLGQICDSGYAFLLDNTSGSTAAVVLLDGASGTTNTHTASVYLRVSAGIGEIGVEGGASTESSITSGYRQISWTGAPATAADRMAITAQPGAVVYFVLPQFEESWTATPVIETTGVAGASREADEVGINPLGEWWPGDQFTVHLRARTSKGHAPSGVPEYFFAAHDGTTNNFIVVRRALDTRQINVCAVKLGVTQWSVDLGEVPDNTEFLVDFSGSPTGYAANLNGGEPLQVSIPPGGIPVCNQAQIGQFLGTGYANGYIVDLAIYPTATGASALPSLPAGTQENTVSAESGPLVEDENLVFGVAPVSGEIFQLIAGIEDIEETISYGISVVSGEYRLNLLTEDPDVQEPVSFSVAPQSADYTQTVFYPQSHDEPVTFGISVVSGVYDQTIVGMDGVDEPVTFGISVVSGVYDQTIVGMDGVDEPVTFGISVVSGVYEEG